METEHVDDITDTLLGKGHMKPKAAKMRRLKKRIIDVTREKDIKKHLGYMEEQS
jgi:hypothetical protein